MPGRGGRRPCSSQPRTALQRLQQAEVGRNQPSVASFFAPAQPQQHDDLVARDADNMDGDDRPRNRGPEDEMQQAGHDDAEVVDNDEPVPLVVNVANPGDAVDAPADRDDPRHGENDVPAGADSGASCFVTSRTHTLCKMG